LADDEWYATKDTDGLIFRYRFKGDNGTYNCFARVRPEEEYLIFYAVTPINIPENKRQAVSEYLTRANYGLYIGNFEMDFSDGEVRYKASMDFEGLAVPTLIIKNAIYPTVRTMDKYYAGILAILYGNKTPLDAVNEVEGN